MTIKKQSAKKRSTDFCRSIRTPNFPRATSLRYTKHIHTHSTRNSHITRKTKRLLLHIVSWDNAARDARFPAILPYPLPQHHVEKR